MFNPQPTKALITTQTYERIAKTLLNRARRLMDCGEMGVITDAQRLIAFAYLDAEPFIAASTARLYHAAAVYWLQQHPGEYSHEATELLCPEPSEITLFREEELAQKRAANLTHLRGSQQKAMWLDPADWLKLLNALTQHSGTWSGLAEDWLLGGLITGLRPCEWRTASWAAPKLIVINAKATQGRAHGKTRTLDLTRATGKERDIVERLTGYLSSRDEDGYRTAYDGVRNLIRRVARETFNRRERFPSLYTTRHVFAARAKATFQGDWVAALMGHASTSTAPRHYASAWRARGGRPLDIEPAQADVDAVRGLMMRARKAMELLKPSST